MELKSNALFHTSWSMFKINFLPGPGAVAGFAAVGFSAIISLLHRKKTHFIAAGLEFTGLEFTGFIYRNARINSI